MEEFNNAMLYDYVDMMNSQNKSKSKDKKFLNSNEVAVVQYYQPSDFIEQQTTSLFCPSSTLVISPENLK